MVFVFGVAALPILLLYIYCLSRSVLFGWISLLAVQLYVHTFGISRVDVGSLHIDASDVCQLCFIVAGVIRTVPRLRERSIARTYVLAYLCIFAFSLLRGILAHGIAHAGNDSRPFAAFLIACLYFLTAPVDPQSVRKYVVVLLYFGLGLALVMLLASVGLPVGGVAMANHDPDQLAMLDGRLLPADSALALAFCFFFSIASFDRKRMSLLSKSLPMLFLGAVVLLRHRTVWVVLIAVLIYFLLKDRATFRRLVPLGVLACLVMAVYAGFLAGSSAHSLGATFSDSATNDITWQWRLAGWLQLLGNERATAINIMFGNSLGGGYERFDPISLVYIDTIPHSEYVTQYFNLGVAGLAMVLCLMIRPFQRFWKLSSTNMQAVAPSASAWAVVILGIMVYGISYDPPVEAYALLGIANAMVIRLDKSTQNRVPAPALAQAG